MPRAVEVPPGWVLPVTPIPISGESWRSFLRRSATLNDTTVGKLVDACGIVDDDILSQDQRRKAARLAGLQEREVRAMTLNSWTGIALPAEPQPTPNRQGPAWTWLAPTFHCTTCIANGVEMLEWRLPWVTTCAIHGRYLSGSSSREQDLPEDLELDTQHRRRLGIGSAGDHFAIWRDAVRLAIGLRRTRLTRSDAPASHRAQLMSIAAPLAMAESADQRAKVLSDWCQNAGVHIVWGALYAQLRSRPIIDAADTLAARRWFKRRALTGAAG